MITPRTVKELRADGKYLQEWINNQVLKDTPNPAPLVGPQLVPLTDRNHDVITQKWTLSGVLSLILRCRHKTISRVFTDGCNDYVVCLDGCGKRLAYDWSTMSVGKEILLDDLQPGSSHRDAPR